MLTDFFSLPTTMALDVDDEGRLLVLYDGTGTRQINEVMPDGSWRALTALDDTVRTARFVPGSSRVVVEHDFGGSERGQLSMLDLDDQSAPPALVALVHDRAFKHNPVDAKPDRVLYTTNRRNGTDFDLVARALSTGVERVVYEGGGWVMGVKPSPDGKWVVLSLASAPANSMQLLLVDTTSRAVTELTPYDAHNDQQAVSWLPDSSGFVVSSNAGRDRLAVRRYDLDAAAWSDLLVDDERDLAGWVCPDGEHLLVAVTDDGVVSLELHKLADGALVAPLDLPAGGTAARAMMTPDPLWSPDGSFAVLTYGSSVEPPTVYRYTLASGEVVAMRPPGMPELPAELTHPESYRVPSFDGEQVPVFVYRPTGPDLGSTIVHVHGGPEGAAMRNWNPVVAALAAEGHTVVVPNVRGSASYGKRWYSLDDRELRLDSVKDLAAIHAWLPSIGLDPSRAALWGGSYGGYMVLAGLAFQPTLWAAGVDIVGIASLVTFLENTSDYRRATREREYGYLATDRDFLEEASPLSRVDDIRAPLFVIHGANDPRVPLSEAEQITEALAKRDIPCQLLVYSDEGHGLAKLDNKLDAYPKAFTFLREHLTTAE
ncbi:dipeptidyl aminopeptidase/acylaminoacyl peptidase [Kribbella antiqua]|uniref:Dipeptidyl aminopeptidase/acylaminoacyl peptidase n=1 Tax=Kribbella antiqua TaxID=2512217 RepID=A0A4R2IMM3_9ACTN|nr:alpha/beta fold hydrolase [Kribbella antiqua]TCO46037.1 dipeptidyl aminopeptidase/acylaminoacyl peptidase [Kribbella antiqua]